MKKTSKIYIAGHKGMVGSAITRKLEAQGFSNLVFKTSSELDLTEQSQTFDFFNKEKPEYVFMAAARVGGILANSENQFKFLFENSMIALNTIEAARLNGVEKFLFLGSSCVYPANAPLPISEDALLSSALEKTNEAYALAKIIGLKCCENLNEEKNLKFISLMPCNLYGQEDNFHPNYSHVIPGLLRRFHEAKECSKNTVTVWGSGNAQREFLHVDDLANACFLVMKEYSGSKWLNAGSSEEISIKGLSELIAKTVGYEGEIEFDRTKPDGTFRKVMDSSKLEALGWKNQISLEEGLKKTYSWALQNSAL